MKIFEFFKIALTSLRSNKLRTALTSLGIIIGTASVIIIIAIGDGAKSYITGQFDNFNVNMLVLSKKRGPRAENILNQNLKLDDLELLKKTKIPNIKNISASGAGNFSISTSKDTSRLSIVGTDENMLNVQSLNLTKGTFLTKDHSSKYAKVAVIGDAIAKDYFEEGEEVIGNKLKINGKSFKVIGILKEQDSTNFFNPNELIYVPITTFFNYLSGNKDLQEIYALTEDINKIEDTKFKLESILLSKYELEKDDAFFEVNSTDSALETVNSVLGMLTNGLAGIAAISLVVGGIGILNIMIVTVTERTREIGLYKAIGAKKNHILTLFLIEACLVTLLSGFFGTFLGLAINFVITKFSGIPFIITVRTILYPVIVSIVCGIVFGMYPARKAANLSAIDALKYE